MIPTNSRAGRRAGAPGRPGGSQNVAEVRWSAEPASAVAPARERVCGGPGAAGLRGSRGAPRGARGAPRARAPGAGGGLPA